MPSRDGQEISYKGNQQQVVLIERLVETGIHTDGNDDSYGVVRTARSPSRMGLDYGFEPRTFRHKKWFSGF